MANKKEATTGKRRAQVKDLPKKERELTPEERKKIKGGVFGFEPQPITADRSK